MYFSIRLLRNPRYCFTYISRNEVVQQDPLEALARNCGIALPCLLHQAKEIMWKIIDSEHRIEIRSKIYNYEYT